MAHEIIDYFPNQDRNEVRARLDPVLFKTANIIRRSHNLTWTEVLSSLVKKFVDDVPPKGSELAATKRHEQVDFLANAG